MPSYAVPRTDYSGMSYEDQLRRQYNVDPTNFHMPAGYEWDPNFGEGQRIRKAGSGSSFMDKWGFPLMGGLVGGGALAGLALPAAGASGFGYGAGAAAGVPAGLPGAASLGGSAGISAAPLSLTHTIGSGTSPFMNVGSAAINGAKGGGGVGGFLKGLAGKLDPNMLLGLGMSLFGGSDQERKGYTGAVAPQRVMEEYFALLNRLGSAYANRPAFRLSSSFVPAPPSPVDIPGLGFQIGGGLGRDPALDNPSMLDLNNDWMKQVFSPQPNRAQGTVSASKSSPGSRTVRRRVV